MISLDRMLITLVSKVIVKLGMIRMVRCIQWVIRIRFFLGVFKKVSCEFLDGSHGPTADHLSVRSIYFMLGLDPMKISSLVHVMWLDRRRVAGETELI